MKKKIIISIALVIVFIPLIMYATYRLNPKEIELRKQIDSFETNHLHDHELVDTVTMDNVEGKPQFKYLQYKRGGYIIIDVYYKIIVQSADTHIKALDGATGDFVYNGPGSIYEKTDDGLIDIYTGSIVDPDSLVMFKYNTDNPT